MSDSTSALFLARLLESPAASKLGLSIVHFVWQGALLWVVAAVLLAALRRARPQARYAALLIVLGLMVACPVAAWFLTADGEPIVQPAESRAPGTPLTPESAPGHGPAPLASVLGTGRAAPAPHQAAAVPPPAWRERWLAGAEMARAWVRLHSPWFTVAWLGGVCLLSLRLLLGVTGAERAKRLGIQSVSPPVERLLVELTATLRIRQSVRVVESALAGVPTVVGWLRPLILLPASVLTGVPPQQLKGLLAHELAHIRRHDYLVNVLQTVIETLLFYHPAVWWVSGRIRQERELCCDDLAVEACGDRLAYARALAGLVPLTRPATWAVAAGGGSLVARIARLAGRPTPRAGGSASWLASIVVVSAAMALGGGLYVSTDAAGREDGQAGRNAEAPSAGEEQTVAAEPAESGAANNAPADDAERQAIEKGIAYLKGEQQEDGSWTELQTATGGVSALCLTALLKAGVAPEDAAVQRALTCLRKIEPQSTYTVALQTMALCAASPEQDAELIRRNCAWLEKAQVDAGPAEGGWSYTQGSGGRADGSCTRFAVLGLDAANRAGFDVPAETWQRASQYWMTSQNPNGGWGYQREAAPTPTMTCAGVACLGAANDHLPRDEATEVRRKAIERAFGWLDQTYDAAWNCTFRYYYVHALERAAHLAGADRVGEHNWRADGAKRLLAEQDADQGLWPGTNGGFGGGPLESSHIATSFALLFLSGTPEIPK